MTFDAIWQTSDGTLREGLLPSREKDAFAKGMARMLTAFYLRFGRPGGEPSPLTAANKHIPIRGTLPWGMSFLGDVRISEHDKPRLTTIREQRDINLELFLFKLFHLDFQWDYTDPAGTRHLKEWQPFAHRLSSLMDGFEEEMIATYGDIAGQQAAMRCYMKYLAEGRKIGSPSHSLFQHRESFMKSVMFSHVVGVKTRRVIKTEPGVDIEPLLRQRIALLDQFVKGATPKKGPKPAAGSARWLARALAGLSGEPVETWVTRAHITETVVFPMVGVLFILAIRAWDGFGLSGPAISAFAAFLTYAIWVFSHPVLFVDGEWVSAQDHPSLRQQVRWLGLLVGFLPVLALGLGGIHAFVISLVTSFLAHRSFNRHLLKSDSPSVSTEPRETNSLRASDRLRLRLRSRSAAQGKA